MKLSPSAKGLPVLRDYEILAKIADGSMATVYRARRRSDHEFVAVKIASIVVARNPVYFERFQREYRLGARLDHPNVIRTLDFGKEGTTCFLVLEFVDGQDLWERIREAGKLPEREAVDVIVQAARGLHAAHAHGIIHRDVKPENILIGFDGVVKLADLGLIRDLESDVELTDVHKGLGTPNFMAPEQFSEARDADVRCDIYSLAASLYMAVTGELPFVARTLGATLKKKLASDLTPPRQLAPNLSERVDWAIRRALQADPQRRQANCVEFIEALTGEPEGALSPVVHPRRRLPRSRERRRSVRYPCTRAAVCANLRSIHPEETDALDHWEGKIHDLSEMGMGLCLTRRFEPGTFVNMMLASPDQSYERRVRLRVTRVSQGGKNQWFTGGSFDEPLSKEELKKLL